MDEDLFIQDEYHELRSFAEIRLTHVCFCRLQKWNFAKLCSPFWRWYWNRNPGAFISLQGNRFELTPDRALLIPPNTAFATGVTCPVDQLYMHFALGLDRATNPGMIFIHPLAENEQLLVKQLVAALVDKEGKRTLEISFLSHSLAHSALATVSPAHWEGRLPNDRINQALRSIKANAPQAVSNKRLAEEAGINVNAFTKLFLQATGRTPLQYLIQLRLDEACRLLNQTSQGIDEIAERTGFCDRYHFSRIFKQHLGASPAAFRKRSQK